MKKWINYAFLIVVVGTMTCLLIFQTEHPLSIIVSPKIYSHYHTNNTETITIGVLTTDPNHYYFSSQFISSISISSTDVHMAFDVHEIQKDDRPYSFNDLDYYEVQFELRTTFQLTDTKVQMSHATMDINYENGEQLTLQIGEFNYWFHTTMKDDLTLGGLQATYHSTRGYPTVSGVHLTLTNQSDHPITITDITLLSTSTLLNTNYIRYFEPCDTHSTVEDCLWIEEYNDTSTAPLQDLTKTIQPHQTIELYLPLLFYGIPHIESFAIDVSYDLRGNEYHMILDDFPFVKTALFQEGYEEGYLVYDGD